MGGAVAAIERLHEAAARRVQPEARSPRIESGEQIVVGVNALHRDRAVAALGRRPGIDPDGRRRRSKRDQIERLKAWRADRDGAAVKAALAELERAATKEGRNVMPPSIACAKAGVTTGEWGRGAARRLRRVPRADRRRAAPPASPTAASKSTPSAQRRRRVATPRPAHQDPGRQARPRRPFQRRRADRRARPRLRHGGRLRGHPPDARADRQRRRSRRACTSSACRSCRAATSRW